jgi:hypothetical protein
MTLCCMLIFIYLCQIIRRVVTTSTAPPPLVAPLDMYCTAFVVSTFRLAFPKLFP